MTVTRDIITDLLPLYHSGEASVDTRKLVEEFLAADPEFQRLAEKLLQVKIPACGSSPSPGVEQRSLDRTKRMIARRSWLMGLAIFFSLAPFSMYHDGTTLRWVMFRDAPTASACYLLVAALLWGFYFLLRRKAKAILP